MAVCIGDGLVVDENGRLVPAQDHIHLGHVGNQPVAPPTTTILWDTEVDLVEESGDTYTWTPADGTITVERDGLYLIQANHRDSPSDQNVGAQVSLTILVDGVRTGGQIITRVNQNSHRLEAQYAVRLTAGQRIQVEWGLATVPPVAPTPYNINGDARNHLTVTRLS